MSTTHWDLTEFIGKHQLPIYIENVAAGLHPEYEFHDHNVSEIVFVLSGTAEHVVQLAGADGETGLLTSPVSAGDILVVHPGVIHAYAKAGTLELCNLVYDRKRLTLPLLDGYSLPLFKYFFPMTRDFDLRQTVRPVATLTPEEMASLKPRLDMLDGIIQSMGPGSLIETLTVVLDVLVTLGKMRLAGDSGVRHDRYRMEKALYLIERDVDRTPALDELARAANMSRRNFSRQFRLMAGTSPSHYMLLLKIQRAADLLADTDLDITSIALRCGFCDSNYFCKQFRKNRHMTPSEFRKAARSGGAQ